MGEPEIYEVLNFVIRFLLTHIRQQRQHRRLLSSFGKSIQRGVEGGCVFRLFDSRRLEVKVSRLSTTPQRRGMLRFSDSRSTCL